jgi:hypothetical protein
LALHLASEYMRFWTSGSSKSKLNFSPRDLSK